MEKNEIDIEIKRLNDRISNIPKVTNRYMRMRFNRNLRTLKNVLNLKWRYQS